MRILFLSQLVPFPIDAGPKVRSYHVLKYLVAAGHEVTLVAFRRINDKPEDIAHLETICHKVHTVLLKRSRIKDVWHLGRSLVSNLPVSIARDDNPAMHKLLKKLAISESFDVVHADQLSMAQYALALKTFYELKPERPKFVLDQHNAMFLIPERLAANNNQMLMHFLLTREALVMRGYEAATCQRFDQVVWVTQEDVQALHRETYYRGADRVIPICVDINEKQPVTRQDGKRITFLGGLHWPPNYEGIAWFIDHVWPAVQLSVPDTILTIIGKDPPAAISHKKSQIDKIEVTGYVDSLEPYLAETAVFIVPLHSGGGMRVKIIDAWAWELPIVSTTVGAEGVMACHGVNILLADSPDDFSAGVIRLLEDRTFADVMAANGRTTAEECYDWRKIYNNWEEIYA